MNMIDPAIENFFKTRKEKWIKKEESKKLLNDLESREKNSECDRKFSLENWLPDAARRAQQRSFATHPCTFSHPSARQNFNGDVSSFIAECVQSNDGYLRTGNIEVKIDSLGNAAALDVYDFLTLEMEDGRKLIEHMEEDSPLAISLLSIRSETYETLKNGFLAMISSNDNKPSITSSKIKQVYFPVENTYHQLSLLTNSGMVYELKNRIDKIRFSDEKKDLKQLKRNNEYSEKGFSELYNLTVISYGGTKPQNISVLNSSHGGKAHLLLSLPPTLDTRKITFPKHDFFKESLRYNECREIFHALHKLFATEYNNIHIREGRDYHVQSIMDYIVEQQWAIREICKQQYDSERSKLKYHQKVWLCDEDTEIRYNEDDWIEIVCKDITLWIIRSYEKLLGKNAYKLGEAERIHIEKIILENKEMLR